MLWNGDRDVIDVLVVEDRAVVVHGFGGIESTGPLVGALLPAIGNDDPLDVVLVLQIADCPDVRHPLAAGPDESDANAIVGPDHARITLGRQGRSGERSAGRLQETASRKLK